MSRYKKIQNSNSSETCKPRPLHIIFRIKRYSVLVHSRTKSELDDSMFSQVTKLRENFQKIPNLNKFERFDRFWPNSNSKVLD